MQYYVKKPGAWTWTPIVTNSLADEVAAGRVGCDWRLRASEDWPNSTVDEFLRTRVLASSSALPAAKEPSYWFGYLYAAFWAFVTYSCFTHAVVAIRVVSVLLGSQTRDPLDTQTQAKLIATTILWPLATLLFAWVTYRLLARKVTLRMIYVLVCIHATNVLFEGLIPYKLLIWAVLGAIVVINCKDYFRPHEA